MGKEYTSGRRISVRRADVGIWAAGRRKTARHPRNARFWIFHIEGYVKLTMAPGDCLNHYRAWTHEEGWSNEFFTLQYDGAVVEMSGGTGGRDCDGILETAHAYDCKLENLRALEFSWEKEMKGERFPDWEKLESSQRDHAAEAAGY